MTPKILSETPWSYAVGADPSRGYHLRYKVVCYDKLLTDDERQDEQERTQKDRGTMAQDPAQACRLEYGLTLIPEGTYDRELAMFTNSVIYRELLDSGD